MMIQKSIAAIQLPGLASKTAAITGAGGAICGAIARALGQTGCRVAIWDIKRESAQATVDSITATGGQAVACQCDAANRADVERAARETVAAFGGIDILITPLLPPVLAPSAKAISYQFSSVQFSSVQ